MRKFELDPQAKFHLGLAARKERLRLNLSQVELSHAAGVSVSAISQLERGVGVGQLALGKICAVFGTTEVHLLTEISQDLAGISQAKVLLLIQVYELMAHVHQVESDFTSVTGDCTNSGV
ncbi:MAG: helix-turn-helix transcriptional regulator [Gemmatimonadales bacterium]|nr:helix-turn-helix transcriptional regulator [Gemmatimonadales bacterium]